MDRTRLYTAEAAGPTPPPPCCGHSILKTEFTVAESCRLSPEREWLLFLHSKDQPPLRDILSAIVDRFCASADNKMSEFDNRSSACLAASDPISASSSALLSQGMIFVPFKVIRIAAALCSSASTAHAHFKSCMARAISSWRKCQFATSASASNSQTPSQCCMGKQARNASSNPSGSFCSTVFAEC